MAPDTIDRSAPKLADPTLFREQCYVNGAWIGADDGGTMTGDQPGDRRASARADLRRRPRLGAPSRPRTRALPAWRAKTAKERGAILRKWNDLILANRRPRADPDHGAGQAVGRGQGR